MCDKSTLYSVIALIRDFAVGDICAIQSIFG